ncbi:MAG: HNH endonuclease [bacterium]
MSRTCLALNASYEPMHMLDVNRAARLLLDGRAELVERHESLLVRSEKVQMPRPVVIRLKNYVHVPRNLRKQVTNTLLFARDDYTCSYCLRTDKQLRRNEFLNRDHVLPLSRGGKNDWNNVATACSSCNTKKDDRTPREAGMTLHITPMEPHFVHLKWTVRNLTGMQTKYVEMFYGSEMLSQVKRLLR